MMCVIASQYNFKIEWFFLVRGHSYMPADRSFGLVEKKIRNIETVLLPEEYDKLFKKAGTLHALNSDFRWTNWQELSQKCVPSVTKFKISKAKRLTLKPKSASVYKHKLLNK